MFVVTGCEEASMGGADALGRVMKERWGWDPSDTVFVGLMGFETVTCASTDRRRGLQYLRPTVVD